MAKKRPYKPCKEGWRRNKTTHRCRKTNPKRKRRSKKGGKGKQKNELSARQKTAINNLKLIAKAAKETRGNKTYHERYKELWAWIKNRPGYKKGESVKKYLDNVGGAAPVRAAAAARPRAPKRTPPAKPLPVLPQRRLTSALKKPGTNKPKKTVRFALGPASDNRSTAALSDPYAPSAPPREEEEPDLGDLTFVIPNNTLSKVNREELLLVPIARIEELWSNFNPAKYNDNSDAHFIAHLKRAITAAKRANRQKS